MNASALAKFEKTASLAWKASNNFRPLSLAESFAKLPSVATQIKIAEDCGYVFGDTVIDGFFIKNSADQVFHFFTSLLENEQLSK
jgi:hypothetical protein